MLSFINTILIILFAIVLRKHKIYLDNLKMKVDGLNGN